MSGDKPPRDGLGWSAELSAAYDAAAALTLRSEKPIACSGWCRTDRCGNRCGKDAHAGPCRCAHHMIASATAERDESLRADAPAMLGLLQKIQWGPGGDCDPGCPTCGAREKESHHDLAAGVHSLGCALAALLDKHGRSP